MHAELGEMVVRHESQQHAASIGTPTVRVLRVQAIYVVDVQGLVVGQGEKPIFCERFYCTRPIDSNCGTVIYDVINNVRS